MPKLNKKAFKLSGDNFEDFAPVVSALFEDGVLVTAHLSDDDKPWTATADDCDRETLDGIIESIDLDGDVTVSLVTARDLVEEGEHGVDESDDADGTVDADG